MPPKKTRDPRAADTASKITAAIASPASMIAAATASTIAAATAPMIAVATASMHAAADAPEEMRREKEPDGVRCSGVVLRKKRGATKAAMLMD